MNYIGSHLEFLGKNPLPSILNLIRVKFLEGKVIEVLISLLCLNQKSATRGNPHSLPWGPSSSCQQKRHVWNLWIHLSLTSTPGPKSIPWLDQANMDNCPILRSLIWDITYTKSLLPCDNLIMGAKVIIFSPRGQYTVYALGGGDLRDHLRIFHIIVTFGLTGISIILIPFFLLTYISYIFGRSLMMKIYSKWK